MSPDTGFGIGFVAVCSLAIVMPCRSIFAKLLLSVLDHLVTLVERRPL